MKFRVERDALADAVAWTAKSLPARPPVPVLAGVLLEVADHTLTVSGFDYEVSSQVNLEITAGAPGRTLVSGRLLAEITRALPDRPVDLALDSAQVELTCGSARFTLPTMPVEDYPTLPSMPTETGTVAADEFAAAVAQVVVAAGRDDTLPVLTGVRLEMDGDQLTLATTDRYRLAVRELSWSPSSPGATAHALVPARTLSETAKAMATSQEPVTIALAAGATGEGLVGFSGAGRRTTTRLLDGEFPKYRSLFPDTHAAQANVPTAALIEVVKRVALVAERNTPVRLTFSPEVLTLEAGGSENARASESMDCAYDGEEMTIAFNPQFLLDGLGAINAPSAVLSFTAPTKPAVITGALDGAQDAGSDGGETDPAAAKANEAAAYRYLLMPVRVTG
jgi:DNA polymerase-3 subunit beta